MSEENLDQEYQSEEVPEEDMREWANNLCTREFLRILEWEKGSLSNELIFKSDDELSTFLKKKGEIFGIDKIIGLIKALAEPEEKEEDEAIESNPTV
jgi:hypothetical protein